jgi:chromosome partitioning protein
LVVDVDHQSSLSIVMLGNKLWEETLKKRQTCNTIFESFCNTEVSMPGKEIIFNNPIYARYQYSYNNLYPTLDIVPAQFELDDTEKELAATTSGNHFRSEWQKRTLLAKWLDSVNADNDYDFILFDCPPATKFVSQNALAASNYFLIPVIPDVMSSRGVTHFKNLVTQKIDNKLESLRNGANIREDNVPKSYVPKTKMLAIVPSMAKPANNAASGYTNAHTQQLDSLKREWGDDMLKNVIKSLTGVTEAIDQGWPVWNLDTQNIKAAEPMFENVCTEIYTRIIKL